MSIIHLHRLKVFTYVRSSTWIIELNEYCKYQINSWTIELGTNSQKACGNTVNNLLIIRKFCMWGFTSIKHQLMRRTLIWNTPLRCLVQTKFVIDRIFSTALVDQPKYSILFGVSIFTDHELIKFDCNWLTINGEITRMYKVYLRVEYVNTRTHSI